MNYMKQVAEMLGLEWDDEKQESEEFSIELLTGDVFIPKYKLMYKQSNGFGIYIYSVLEDSYNPTNFLSSILSGSSQIKKLPKKWKPKYEELYYYPSISSCWLATATQWQGCDTDNHRYNNNLIYATKDEAIAEAKRILKLREDTDK